MAYKVIAISREFGSGGRSIGKALANDLNIKCYDKEIIEKIASESGYDPKYIEENGEGNKTFLDRIFSTPMYTPSNEDNIWALQCDLILKASEEPCIIVGRCADYLLQDREDVLKVFVYADIESRADRIVKVYGESDVKPLERVKDKDKKRIAYYEHYTSFKWGDAHNYDICLNSSKLGIDKCISIIKDIYNKQDLKVLFSYLALSAYFKMISNNP